MSPHCAHRTIVALAVALLTTTALTPTPLYSVRQIRARVTELETVTLEMNSEHVLASDTARTIINWTKDATALLAGVPKGWRERLASTWTAAKPTIHTTNPPVLEKMAAIDAVLGT